MSYLKCATCKLEKEVTTGYYKYLEKQSKLDTYTCSVCKKSGDTTSKQAKSVIANTHVTADMKAFIPQNDNVYVDRKIQGMKDLTILEKAYIQKYSTLLIGETGSGKTHSIRQLAYKLKVPYMRVNLNGATTPDDLIGQWVPNSAGQYVWQDGVLTLFLKYGGIFVADEINACPPDILFLFNSILDDEHKLVLVQKDGEVIKAHKDFVFFSTMNPDYEGTKPLNAALKDRFQLVLQYDYDSKVEKKLISNVKLIDLAKSLRKMYVKGEIMTPTSTRTLIQYEQNFKVFGEKLAKTIFLNKFLPEERQPIESLMELTMGKKSEEKHAEGKERNVDEDKEDNFTNISPPPLKYPRITPNINAKKNTVKLQPWSTTTSSTSITSDGTY